MFDDQNNPSTKKNTDFINPAGPYDYDAVAKNKKKKIIIIITFFILGILAIGFLFWWLNLNKPSELIEIDNKPIEVNEEPKGPGVFLDPNKDSDYVDNNIDDKNILEYLAFGDFYKFTEASFQDVNYKGYKLPINVKLDVSNYYELSRKIDLDNYIGDLNNKGFAIINNPWISEGNDFYSLTNAIDKRNLPLFLSIDLISYYYQNILKTSYKEIEENVFYDSLWNISKELYDRSRLRYEAHVAKLGNINDPVLEAERLATAYFAISLELLKPNENQIMTKSHFSAGIFDEGNRDKYSFEVPTYLNDDVLQELALIYKARGKQKSPVLLYDRDYSNFIVPAEYRNNARLYNFYLAAAWLNSTFPLNYRSADCPDCLLDQDDWRINFIASIFIADDFSISQEIKNEWARVYKILSFFKGLRDSWNYIDYHDSFVELFGAEANINELFAEDNIESENNLKNLRSNLLGRQLLASQGAYDLDSDLGRRSAGLQFLADFYWPNEFILSSLRYPVVSNYKGGQKMAENNTACNLRGQTMRCQGSSQDILKLIYPDWQNDYFAENSNYSGYLEAVNNLRPITNEVLKVNLNKYWSSMYLWQNVLSNFEREMPIYLQSDEWKNIFVESALAAWVDMQLPISTLNVRERTSIVNSLSTDDFFDNITFMEPNISFFDRIIAQNRMIIDMLEALRIKSNSGSAITKLKDAEEKLFELRELALKQSRGEDFDVQDNQVIRNFATMYELVQAGSNSFYWHNSSLDVAVKQVIADPKLILIAYPVGDKIMLSLGPIYNHIETK